MSAPNIVLLLIDDLGWRDLACYGSSFYETSCLDRLAAQGMLFTSAYASCPVCSPTRASIMSGKYPARVGITQFIGGHTQGRLAEVPYLHHLPLQETSLATALRDGGYQTWHVGKWHLGDAPFYPENHGFDINLGGCEWGQPRKGYFSPWHIPNMPDGREGEYLTDHLTDLAIELVKKRDKSRPFFLNFWHYTVHTPIQAPPALVEKYRDKARRLALDTIDPIVDGGSLRKMSPSGGPPAHIQRRIIQSDPAYAAMIENLDANTGRLLAALDEQGLADNTIVVFTSDNGGLATAEGSPTCNLPLAEGKGWSQEGGTRVCQLIRWPVIITPGSRCDVPVTSTDFYPTLLHAAGLPPQPKQHCDGVSLMPLLRGGDTLDREAVFWHYPHYSNQGGCPASSLVSGQWKLIENYEDDRLELYDLAHDISETRNLADIHPDVAQRLLALLHSWRKDVSAKIPGPNPNYKPLLPNVPNDAPVRRTPAIPRSHSQ